MFIGKYELDNKIYNNIYYSYDEWYKDTFSCNSSNHDILNFKISGKTYKDRQNSLRELAIDYSNNFASLNWSYSELAGIGDYFYNNGKRYGLLKEFRENGIC